MSSTLAAIITAAESMVSRMTVANGYNYNWAVDRGERLSYRPTGTQSATIWFDIATGDDATEAGGVGSSDQRRVDQFSAEFLASPAQFVGQSSQRVQERLSMLAAFEDVARRYSSTYNAMGDAGAQILERPRLSRVEVEGRSDIDGVIGRVDFDLHWTLGRDLNA